MPVLEFATDETKQPRSFLMFWCPGCEMYHGVRVGEGPHPRWTWNGDEEKPTFSPSLLVHKRDGKTLCHLFVRDGQLEFLSDSAHALAGKTVPMVDLETLGEED